MTGEAADVLGLAFGQSYGKDVRPGPAPRRAAFTGAGRPLGRGLWSALDGAPFPVTGVAPRRPAAAVADVLLHTTLGISRYEPANAYNPHASVPSARCAFAVRAHVVADGEVRRYCPARHEWQVVRRGVPSSEGTFHVHLAADPHAFAASYGDVRFALALLEAGHAVASLVLVGMALGLHSRVDTAFAGDGFALLGGSDEWLPAAVLTFGRDAEPRPAAPPVPGDTGAPYGTLAGALWRRSAGRAPAGLSASPRPVPAEAVRRAAAEAARHDVVAGTTGPAAPVVTQYWVTERVTGLPDGVHRYDPATAALRTVRKGSLLGAVQEAFAYPPTSIGVTSMAAVGLLVVDYPALAREHGAAAFRVANVHLGAAAQAASLALAADGLFARPCRSYDEAALDVLLGLDASETVAYQLLCGRGRFTDVLLDLRM